MAVAEGKGGEEGGAETVREALHRCGLVWLGASEPCALSLAVQ